MSERPRLLKTKATEDVLNTKQAFSRLRFKIKKSHLEGSRWPKERLEIVLEEVILQLNS